MKRISYSGGSFVTGDAIARALLVYAADLANTSRAAELTVPAINPEGEREDVLLLIGPASQLLAVAVHQEPELEDPDFVASVDAQTRHLRRLSTIDATPFEEPKAG